MEFMIELRLTSLGFFANPGFTASTLRHLIFFLVYSKATLLTYSQNFRIFNLQFVQILNTN